MWIVAIGLSLSGALLAVTLPETRPQISRPRLAFAIFSRYAAIPSVTGDEEACFK